MKCSKCNNEIELDKDTPFCDMCRYCRSIQEVNRLLEEAGKIASHSGGNPDELQRSLEKDVEALQKVRELIKHNTEDGVLWSLVLGCMSLSGVWNSSDGPIHASQLEVIENMIRLNPEDNDEAYKESYFEPDYASSGGLYYLKFKVL